MKFIGFSHLEPFAEYFHDTNIGMVENDKICFGALEERYSRIKHHAGFPNGALKAMLKHCNVDMDNQVKVVLSENRDSSIIDTSNFIPENRFHKDIINFFKEDSRILYCHHQLAHASVAFRLSPFRTALVITLDGLGHDFGKQCFGAVIKGEDNHLKRLKTCWSSGNSLGLFYGMVTEALGWRISDGEGKTMGLSAYGNADVLYNELVHYAPHVEGSDLVGGYDFNVKSDLINYRHSISEPAIAHLSKLAKQAGREQLAAAAQKLLEDIVIKWVDSLLRQYTEIKNICLGGGIFLNVSVNTKLREFFPNFHFFVPPSPADAGIGIGAALEAAAYYGAARPIVSQVHFLGSKYNLDTLDFTERGFIAQRIDEPADKIALALERGDVVGLYQGRSEWGPRALGNRSVLANPMVSGIRDRINRNMKKRELFMPFAPAILESEFGNWFEGATSDSPYMMFTYRALSKKAHLIRSVLHVDNTGRVQTVSKKDNPLLFEILRAFYKRTNYPLLLNTSFNLHGLPIVETPEEALDHLRHGCVDCLFINHTMVRLKKKKGKMYS